MSAKNADDQFSDRETKRRMNDALRRALSTPHKPNQAFVGRKAKPDSTKVRKVKARKPSK
jgi:hypothetical protein